MSRLREVRCALIAALALMQWASFLNAQPSWNLANCQASAPVGHVCTVQHLDTDLALLTAREIVNVLDPEFRARELVHRRDPQTHLPDPEAIPDPRTDPAYIDLLHAWAERGVVESDAAPLPVTTARPQVDPLADGSLRVDIDDWVPRGEPCRADEAALRGAVVDTLYRAGLQPHRADRESRTLSVSLMALGVSDARCAAFVSVAIRLPPTEYQRAIQSIGSKIAEERKFVVAREPDFARRLADEVEKSVVGVMRRIR